MHKHLCVCTHMHTHKHTHCTSQRSYELCTYAPTWELLIAAIVEGLVHIEHSAKCYTWIFSFNPHHHTDR